MAHSLIKMDDTMKFNKNGVDFVGYGKANENVSVVLETVERGHFEEFVHDKSTFIYLFLEGKGIFFLNDKKVEVTAGDMLIIEPGTRIYYFGKLKQVLIATPSYDQNFERHIRSIDESENIYDHSEY